MTVHFKNRNISSILVLTFMFVLPITVLAAELDSPNYKIVGATTDGGGIVTSTNYATLLGVGSIANDPRIYSSSYKIGVGPEAPFVPAVPTTSCFETTTSGSSSCVTGPAELTTGGMVAICGGDGCYNKARFEIDTKDNPSDTLYAVMISQDSFVSDIRYIDASSFWPENYSDHNLNDFMTKEDWELETFNIQGLEANTTYYIKIFALKGDFTQTDPGPSSSVTTATGAVFFDIDIAGQGQTTAESAAPYSISFTGLYELIGGSAAITAGDRIWMDAESNSQGGFAIIMNGINGGLYSDTTTQLLASATADLDQVASGFGLQSEYVDSDPYLSSITVESNYGGTYNSVGEISTTPNRIYQADGPVNNGRMGIKVIAKPGTTYTPASDYQETIYLIFVPRY
jgi:hypothetical protein